MLFVPQASMCGAAWYGMAEAEAQAMCSEWAMPGNVAPVAAVAPVAPAAPVGKKTRPALNGNPSAQAGMTSKAMVIRNPKTGEVIGSKTPTTATPVTPATTTPPWTPRTPRSGAPVPEAISAEEKKEKLSQRKVESLKSALLKQTDLRRVLLASKGKGSVAGVMARRFGNVPFAPDHSTFTALNIDCNVKDVSKLRTGLVLSHGLTLGGTGTRETRTSLPLKLTAQDTESKEAAAPERVARPLPPVDEASTAAGSTEAPAGFISRSASSSDDLEANSSSCSGLARSFLLRFRYAADVADATVPAQLNSLAVAEVPTLPPHMMMQRQTSNRSGPKVQPSSSPMMTPKSPGASVLDTPGGGRRGRISKGMSLDSMPTPIGRMSRVTTPKSPLEELKRSVMSLLNKICPENVAIICDQVAEIKISTAEELELIISLVFSKAVAEPHYCETYADLAFGLKGAFPEFPSKEEGGRPVTLKSALLDICQREFEAIPTMFAANNDESEQLDPEEIEFRRKKAKNRVLANMKLIGHLFLRQLLSAKVIAAVIQELTLCDRADEVPQEHIIECACELLTSIGYTLESMPIGARALEQVCGRLLELKGRRDQDGKGLYSKRIQFAIQDLLDTRKAGWTKRTFKSSAKTKEEIKDEQRRALNAQARGQDVEAAESVVAGQRPAYINVAGKK